MKVGVGGLLKDSRITRQSMTWGCMTEVVNPPGIDAWTASPTSQVMLGRSSAGLSAYWFPASKEMTDNGILTYPAPHHAAYENLSSPDAFFDSNSTPTKHYYRSGGTPATPRGILESYRRTYADAYRGLSWADDYDSPATATDVLAPGSTNGAVDSLLGAYSDYRAVGGALTSPIIPLAGGGSGMRGQVLAHPAIPLPWYYSCFFRTVRTSFNFFGAYQTYNIMGIFQDDGSYWNIQLGNSTQTIAGTVGRVRVEKNFLGTLYSAYDTSPAITVNDGEWHHLFFWAVDSTTIRAYIDGRMFAERVIANNVQGIKANETSLSSYFFNGFEGDLGFAAVGDATYVTAQRIRHLAACRTFKDRPVSAGGTAVVYQPHSFVYYYDDTTASWVDAESKLKVWDGSKWVPNPKGWNSGAADWERFY